MKYLATLLVALLLTLPLPGFAQESMPAYDVLKPSHNKLPGLVQSFRDKYRSIRKLHKDIVGLPRTSEGFKQNADKLRQYVAEAEAIRRRVGFVIIDIARVFNNELTAKRFGWTQDQYEESKGWYSNVPGYMNDIDESDNQSPSYEEIALFISKLS